VTLVNSGIGLSACPGFCSFSNSLLSGEDDCRDSSHVSRGIFGYDGKAALPYLKKDIPGGANPVPE
jgi:hypothetical protein